MIDGDKRTKDLPPPPRQCDICRAPMVLLSTLPAVGHFPLKRVYKCSACLYATADTVEPLRA
jgi:hypothetical protein